MPPRHSRPRGVRACVVKKKKKKIFEKKKKEKKIKKNKNKKKMQKNTVLFVFFVFLIFSLGKVVLADDAEVPSDVVTLTESNFETYFKDTPLLFAEL